MKNKQPCKCPYCKGSVEIQKIYCEACAVSVDGRFESNEFAGLSGEDLHFLRIFLQFEGRIKDMESPLGLSYPTIRTRITQLKERLFSNPVKIGDEAQIDSKQELLILYGQGKITYDDVLKGLRNKRGSKK